jgi:uncharacterized protein YbcV (DUF1398 family)
MFTIEEIENAIQAINSGADFPQFAAKLKALGVKRTDVYVMNGMSIYFGDDDETVEGVPIYESLLIEEQSNAEELKAALKEYREGRTDYQTFCRQASSGGVEKWIIDLVTMTVAYLDMAGNELLVEKINVS